MKKSTLRRLLSYMSEDYLSLIVVALCMTGGAVCSVRAVYYLKPIINDCLVPLIGSSDPDYSAFSQMLLKMALLYLASVVASVVQSIIMIRVSTGVMYRIRREMFSKMEHFPLSYFDHNSCGRIMSYYTADVDALSVMLRQGIPKIVEGATTIVTIFVTIYLINGLLAVLVTVCVLLIVLVLKLLSGNKKTFFRGQQKAMQDINAYGEEMIAGRLEVKSFNREEKTEEEFSTLSESLFSNVRKVDFFSNSLFDFTSGLENLGFAVIAVLGCLMAIRGMADPGTVGLFLQYYKKIITPLTRMAKQINSVMEAMAGAERVFSFLDLPTEEDDGKVTLEISDSMYWCLESGEKIPCRGDLVFSHVSFSYVEGERVLHDLSFKASAGQTVAFVGTTGAGKTTVINLLSRFYETEGGTITFDGIDVKKIRKEDLRLAAGTVLQDVHLFSATVAQNIRFGNASATDDQVHRAAVTANADYSISLMKDGYDTFLPNAGASLSQGERQLLSIARAAAGTNPVLVLDEATSSVDSLTEMRVTGALEKIMEGKTVLVIAHRLSTIRNADLIIVLDHGRIAESGNHETLMEKKGLYHALYTGHEDN